MKKVLLLLMISSSLFSQKHLIFDSIPMDGAIQEFTKKLEPKGFIYCSKSDEEIKMKDSTKTITFCRPSFFNKTGKDVPAEIRVEYTGLNNWLNIKKKYFELKTELLEKYGKESDSCEKFYEPCSDGDGHEIEDSNYSYCMLYFTKWEIDGNEIFLRYQYGVIEVKYVDNINSQLFDVDKPTKSKKHKKKK